MKDVESAGANPMAALNARLRPVLEKVQANQQTALREARAILSAEQWQKLPPRIRNGRAGGRGGNELVAAWLHAVLLRACADTSTSTLSQHQRVATNNQPHASSARRISR